MTLDAIEHDTWADNMARGLPLYGEPFYLYLTAAQREVHNRALNMAYRAVLDTVCGANP